MPYDELLNELSTLLIIVYLLVLTVFPLKYLRYKSEKTRFWRLTGESYFP